MVKKAATALIVIAALAGAGYAVYWFFIKGPADPSSGLPAELLRLEREVTVRRGKNGQVHIAAHTRNDLLFMQGYGHGQKAGAELHSLREWFKGHPDPLLPADLRAAAPLFFYLDLERVAAECARLYSPQLAVLLRSYAEGLSAGSGAAWSAADVLLLQRGYAFLMGGGFFKEWTAARLSLVQGLDRTEVWSYDPIDLARLDANLSLSSALTGLAGPPPLGSARLISSRETAGLHLRARPFFAFVFEPAALELVEGYTARGVALVGLPFLWAGETDRLRWIGQPWRADDEQFYLISRTAYYGRDQVLFANAGASAADRYPEPPTNAPEGQRVTPLVAGLPPNMDLFYYWDGLRPSADLTASFQLMEAISLDEAAAAIRRRQVPAADWLLRAASGATVNYRAMPSQLDPGERGADRDRRLFRGATLTPTRRLPAVQGLDFSRDRAFPLADYRGVSRNDSALDARLAARARYLLNGMQADAPLEAARSLLAEPGPARDAFAAFLWRQLLGRLRQDLPELDDAAAAAANLALKRGVLAALERGEGTGAWSQGSLATRRDLFADAVREAHADWKRAAESGPPYRLRERLGAERLVAAGPRTEDAAAAAVFSGADAEIARIGAYLLVWSEDFYFWRWVYPPEAGAPSPVKSSPDIGASAVIKPML